MDIGKIILYDGRVTFNKYELNKVLLSKEAEIEALELTFDDIDNVPVADAESVSDWNTFFDLPTNGNPFTSVEVDPNITNIKCGLLYNWWAFTDPRFAPSGYKVPLLSDWEQLRDYLGGENVAGGKLKEIGFEYWDSPNTSATNEVGFDARGCGQRETLTGIPNSFVNKGITAIFASTELDPYWVNFGEYYYVGIAYLSYNNDDMRVSDIGGGTTATIADGISVRYLKINPTASDLSKSDGESCDPCIGNDGKIYPTKKIGNQVWVTANSAETKFNDDTLIPEIPYDPDWSDAGWYNEDPALCAFNNDWSTAFNTYFLVKLYGGSNIHIKDNLFYSVEEIEGEYFYPLDHLVLVEDNTECVVSTGQYSFFHNTKCENFKFPNLVTSGFGSFSRCDNVKYWYFPKLQSVDQHSFSYNLSEADLSSALEFDFPELTIAGAGAFTHNRLVTDFKFPKLQTLDTSITEYGSFLGCIGVVNFDFPLLETISNRAFTSCNASEFNLPSVVSISNRAFRSCNGVTKIYMPSLTNLGETTGDDEVFIYITGRTVELTIPSALMTCNGGNPDGDIQYLQNDNTVTVITV